MALQNSFDVLSKLVEQYESRGKKVRNIEASAADGDRLDVRLDVPVSLCSAGEVAPELTPEAAELTDHGVQVEFASSVLADLPEPTDATVTASADSVEVTSEGLELRVALTIDPGRGAHEPPETETAPPSGVDAGGSSGDDAAADGDTEPEDPFQDVRDPSLPPYEDEAYLRALYQECETFTEMSEAIEMSVSSETVRRYMIEAGIHDPATYDTESAGRGTARTASEPPAPDDGLEIPDEQLVTDGIGMPEGVALDDVVEAVVDASAVYEVQRALGLQRQTTQQLLRELNLLDLVLHRLDSAHATTYEQVAARIRECTPSSS